MIDVLLVEDSAGDVMLTRQILASEGVPVTLHTALDGYQALTMLADQTFEPAVIILDLSLPLVSGYEVLERNPRKDIPIVVFSASFNKSHADQSIALGASEYVQKPMDLDEYRAAIVRMIEKWVFSASTMIG